MFKLFQYQKYVTELRPDWSYCCTIYIRLTRNGLIIKQNDFAKHRNYLKCFCLEAHWRSFLLWIGKIYKRYHIKHKVWFPLNQGYYIFWNIVHINVFVEGFSISENYIFNNYRIWENRNIFTPCRVSTKKNTTESTDSDFNSQVALRATIFYQETFHILKLIWRSKGVIILV